MTEISQEEAAQAAGHSVKAATTYVVLAQEVATSTDITGARASTVTQGMVWRNVGEFTARTAEAAIRQYAEKSGSTTPLVLVAVPARSWQPVKVTPKTTTVLEIASA